MNPGYVLSICTTRVGSQHPRADRPSRKCPSSQPRLMSSRFISSVSYRPSSESRDVSWKRTERFIPSLVSNNYHGRRSIVSIQKRTHLLAKASQPNPTYGGSAYCASRPIIMLRGRTANDHLNPTDELNPNAWQNGIEVF